MILYWLFVVAFGFIVVACGLSLVLLWCNLDEIEPIRGRG